MCNLKEKWAVFIIFVFLYYLLIFIYIYNGDLLRIISFHLMPHMPRLVAKFYMCKEKWVFLFFLYFYYYPDFFY